MQQRLRDMEGMVTNVSKTKIEHPDKFVRVKNVKESIEWTANISANTMFGTMTNWNDITRK
ncbi:hypothetical protein O9G_001142 [Rozella allomycis CSF55]|uniref:Uncharacterized protein n=1 Tax=Rozella allomycis (strain CSF55) TaxID=988480 RepID=A0A075ASE3_ROZAC|nr:hypothetical protein O9G_001142 [Rozella allomycis CSF55]|eukprot:EPZ33173.1 hypothetical protein O9G_001142 [Rozella allomycis CSF55]